MLYKDNGLTFEYSFDSDAASSFLVVTPACASKLQNNQAEIIGHNPSPAFVPFQIRRENENINIYYNITSKISLSQYLERKRLNRKELLELLGSIARNLMLHSNYLLELSSFVMDTDFIFINPATAEVSLVYIPADCDRSSLEVCRGFLKDMVVNAANVDDAATDNYMQRILSYLKADTFSLMDFYRLLVDLRYNEGQAEEAAASDDESTAAVCIASAVRSTDKKTAKGISGRENIFKIVLIQLLVILPAAIIYLFILSKGIADPVSAAGIFIIGAAVDVLIMRRQPKTSFKKEEGHMPVKGRLRATPVSKPVEASGSVEAVRACDTVMLSEPPPADRPYLEGTAGSGNERIMLGKDKYIIGRLAGMADHIIQDKTVGKLHAEIRCRENNCCIIDLNSKNGTYINDIRITSNKEHGIKDEDRIRFSGFEYVFRQKGVL